MQIQHSRQGDKGHFFVETDQLLLADMVYTMAGTSTMIIEHTEVSDELRGKNAGYQLVSTAVDYARKNNIRIIPLCPFANSVFKKQPEFADVLAPKN
jgi:uncharacterized protein